MQTVTSRDGTKIVYTVQGAGPSILLVDGALCYRGFGPLPGLAKLLEPNFTVYTYDRRGRGESGNGEAGAPNIVACEVEDIAALIQAAGGAVSLFGISSGGALALEAAVHLGNKVKKLAVYEAPYDTSAEVVRTREEYHQKITELMAANRRGDMVASFMQLVGTPAEMVDGMRQSPTWPMFEAVAPTLLNDAAVLSVDRSGLVQRAARVTMPALIMAGGASPSVMRDTAQTLAKSIPHGQYRELPDQQHDVNVQVLAPVLAAFFSAA